MKLFIEIIIQTILAFSSILFLTRILGRQQLSQFTMYEYINGITFGSIAATLATDTNQKTWQHLIGLILFGILTFVMSYVSVKNRRISKLIQGEPVLVIVNGHILEKNLTRFYYNIDDLNHLLRQKDIFDIKKVKYGILETTGELSVIKYAGEKTVTANDLNINIPQEHIGKEIIVTGTIIYQNLIKKNLSIEWLIKELNSKGINNIKDVFYAYLDNNNNLYIDTKHDFFNNNKDITEEQ